MTMTFLLRFAIAAVLSMLIASLIASRPAVGATLLPAVTVEADVVTLGDLFAGAGGVADRPVFRSPDPGVDGALPAAAAIAAARAAGLDVDPTPIASVSVVRRSVEVTADDLRALLVDEAAARLGAPPADLAIRFDIEPHPIAAVSAASAPATLENYSYLSNSGRFRAVFTVNVGASLKTVDLTGAAIVTTPVAVLVRPIARNEVIAADDVLVERRDRRFVDGGALSDPDRLVGMAAKRPLRAGEAISASSVEPPRIVRRGQLVTLVYQSPGLALTARGRALADAAMGEAVNVLNEQSRRTVEGVAIGPDKVDIQSRALKTAAAIAAAQSIQ